MMRSMSEMMSSMDSRLGTIEGNSRKKRKVACNGETSTMCAAAQRLQPLLMATDLPNSSMLPSTSPADLNRPAAPLDPPLQREGATANSHIGHISAEPAPSTSHFAHSSAEPTAAVAPAAELRHLPDIPEAVRA